MRISERRILYVYLADNADFYLFLALYLNRRKRFKQKLYVSPKFVMLFTIKRIF